MSKNAREKLLEKALRKMALQVFVDVGVVPTEKRLIAVVKKALKQIKEENPDWRKKIE